MSKSSLINGDTIDFSVIRSVMKDDLATRLMDIEGSKCVVLDMVLSKVINASLEGVSIFKENKVITFTKLCPDPVYTEANSVIFITRPCISMVNLVVNSIINMKSENNTSSYYIFFVPHKTQLCMQYLCDSNILNEINVSELELDIVAVDNDILSVEQNDSLVDLLLRKDKGCLNMLMHAIMKLQILYGKIQSIDAIGRNANDALVLLQDLQSECVLDDTPSQISQLVLVDRSVDLASLFVTPLTYSGLLDDMLGMECGAVSVDGGVIGKKENTKVNVPLNSNDTLFGEMRDFNISVVPQYLKEKSREIQALNNSRPKDTQCSIDELSQFVRKVGTIQDMYESIQTHLGLANMVTAHTNSAAFGERWQRERELLEGDNTIDSLRELISNDVPLLDVLHYFIMYSVINRGLKPKDYDATRKEILTTYGFDNLPLIYNLEVAGFLTRRDMNGNYSSVRNKMKLVRNDIDGSQMLDLNYVTSGYAPLSARIIQSLLTDSIPINEVAKLVGFEYSHHQQTNSESTGKRVVVIAFIGGVTYLEISAIRLIQKQNPLIEILVLTTNIINGENLIRSIIDFSKLPEDESEEEKMPTLQKQFSLSALIQKSSSYKNQ